jgi:hypothetical protein
VTNPSASSTRPSRAQLPAPRQAKSRSAPRSLGEALLPTRLGLPLPRFPRNGGDSGRIGLIDLRYRRPSTAARRATASTRRRRGTIELLSVPPAEAAWPPTSHWISALLQRNPAVRRKGFPTQPVRLAIRASITGTISCWSWKPRYMDNHAKANRLKASSLEAKESLFSNHLLPRLGDKRLDRISDEDVQAIKAELGSRSRKTVNNVIALLGHTLRIALKWKVIGTLPCTIELYKVSHNVPAFYEFEDYARLVEAAGRIDTRTLVTVLLGATRVCVGARSSPCVRSTSISVGIRSRWSRTTGKESSIRPRVGADASSR